MEAPHKALPLAGEIARVAWPVALNWIVVSLTSLLLLLLLSSRGDELGMATLGLATVLCNVTGRTLLWGLGSALDTYASQAWGAQEYLSIGVYAQRSLMILTLMVNFPLAVLWLKADVILRTLGQPEDVSTLTALYTSIRIPGQLAAGVVCVLQKIMVAIEETNALLLINLLVSFTTFALLLGLVAGLGLGVEGAAIATSVSDIMSAVFLVGVAAMNANCRKCWGGWTMSCWRGWPDYLRLACPSLLMVACEEWSWDIVTFLAGLCSTATGGVRVPQRRLLAVQGWLSSIMNTLYSISTAIGRGTGTVVGNSLGAVKPIRARRAALVGVGLSGLMMSCICAGLPSLCAPTAESYPPRNYTPLLMDVFNLRWADGLQMALTGAITGAGAQARTNPVLIVSYWILGLPLGSLWAFVHPKLGLLGIWLGMILAVYLHLLSYPWLPFAISWQAAAEEAQRRLGIDEHCVNTSEPPAPLQCSRTQTEASISTQQTQPSI
ncbi:MAG: hypothetical protein SGPRY_003582, partial [Prymnesium sp.]